MASGKGKGRDKGSAKHDSMRDRARAKAENESSGSSWTLNLPEGVEKFVPKVDGNLIDILPFKVSVTTHPDAKKGELFYVRTYWIHRNVGPDNVVRVCPAKTIGQRCPICEQHAKMIEKYGRKSKEAGALFAKQRDLFNVIDLKEKDKGIQVWDISRHLFPKQLTKELSDRDSEGEDFYGFADLKDGFSIRVRMEEESTPGEGGKPITFLKAGRIDFKDRDDYDDDILEKTVDLDRALLIPKYDELYEEFMGVDAGDADEDKDKEEEEPPKERTRTEGLTKEDEPEDEKPTCFGKEYDKKDKDCKKCDLAEACEDEGVEPEPEPDEPEEPEDDKPECYGKEFGPKDKDCKKCDLAEDCEKDMDADEPDAAGSDDDPGEGECPAKGGTFGKDCDKLDGCAECKKWDSCADELDRLKKEKTSKDKKKDKGEEKSQRGKSGKSSRK